MKKSKNLVTMLLIMLMVAMMLPMSASAAGKAKLNKTKITMNVKKTYQWKVKGTKKKAKWYTSNKKVATVNSKGKVTAKKKGTVKITAKIGGKKYTCRVTVKQPVTSVKLNKKSFTFKKKGQTIQLKATAKPNNANNRKVSWKSSNTSVATVDASGKVTSVSTGTATITATAKDGSKKKASCTVTVKKSRSQSVTTHTHKWVKQTTQMWVDNGDIYNGFMWLPKLNSQDMCRITDEDLDAIRKCSDWNEKQYLNWYNELRPKGIEYKEWADNIAQPYPGYLPKVRTVYDCVKCRTAGEPESVYRAMSVYEHDAHVNKMGSAHAAYDNHDQWYVTLIIRQTCSCGLTKSAYD